MLRASILAPGGGFTYRQLFDRVARLAGAFKARYRVRPGDRMCVIPYGTQEGEISFCAYNTGIGWRQIVENMHMVATTKDWFAERGRHQIYAGDRPMALPKPLKRQLPVVAAEKAAAGGCGTGCGCHCGKPERRV